MFLALQVLTVFLVAVAMALGLAHAIELPGKLRLPKEHYLAMQSTYYPGFTLAGAAEPIGLLMMILLLVVTPHGTAAFWLTTAAFAALLVMHMTYWPLTHPVNNFWLKHADLKVMSAGFFSFDPLKRAAGSGEPDWTVLRDRWEFSHVVRAGLGVLSLILIITATAM